MVDITKIPPSVREALKSREISDADIAVMTPREAFVEYCNWHGFIGWGDGLWKNVMDLSKLSAQAADENVALFDHHVAAGLQPELALQETAKKYGVGVEIVRRDVVAQREREQKFNDLATKKTSLDGEVPKVVIWIEGGIVQGAVAATAVEVGIINYDIDDGDDDALIKIPQKGGEVAAACARIEQAELDPNRAAELLEAIAQREPAYGLRP